MERLPANFSVTRFAYGRGNYQRMEIYGSKGRLGVYSLDVTPGVDELEVCFGYPYDRSESTQKLPIPQRFQCDQMQSFCRYSQRVQRWHGCHHSRRLPHSACIGRNYPLCGKKKNGYPVINS